MEKDVRQTGFFRNKAKAVIAASKAIMERHGGEVPRTMEELTALPGVGRKTANVVLSNAFKIARSASSSTRTSPASPAASASRRIPEAEKIEQDLMKLIPQKEWTSFSHRLIAHGRADLRRTQTEVPRMPVERACVRARKNRWSEGQGSGNPLSAGPSPTSESPDPLFPTADRPFPSASTVRIARSASPRAIRRRETVLADRFASVRGARRREAALNDAAKMRRDVRAVLIDRGDGSARCTTARYATSCITTIMRSPARSATNQTSRPLGRFCFVP